MMFVPKSIADSQMVVQLLNVTSGRDDTASLFDQESEDEQREQLQSLKDGYLILVRCESGTDHISMCPRWGGRDILVEPKAETAIALSHIQVRFYEL